MIGITDWTARWIGFAALAFSAANLVLEIWLRRQR